MKKSMIIGIAAATIVAGCSRDEVLQQNPENEISFQGTFVDNMTRAANDLTTGNLDRIAVYGAMLNSETNQYINIFSDKPVEKKASGKWEYQPSQYWIKGNSYWFTAIAPYGTSTDARHWEFTKQSGAQVASSRGTLTFDNKAANADQDLIIAVPDAIMNVAPASVGAVPFAFQHQLSRVKFTFKNTFSSNIYKIKVLSVQINDAVAKASMALDNTQAWSDMNGDYSILFENAKNTVAQNASEETLHRYLIPTRKAYSVTFKIDIIQNESDIATTINQTVTIPEIDMLKGYSYNIVAAIGENVLPGGAHPIEFTVISVKDWENWVDTNIQ